MRCRSGTLVGGVIFLFGRFRFLKSFVRLLTILGKRLNRISGCGVLILMMGSW
jgi:hypothetical protein